MVDAQNQALAQIALRDPLLSVPRVIHSPMYHSDGPIVRLLTWLEGSQLYQYMPLSEPLLLHLGETLGRLDLALSGLSHPGTEFPLLWDIQRASAFRPLIPDIPDPAIATLCQQVLDHLEEKILPTCASLPRQVIHNDAHPYNVLSDGQQITGILDFGDLITAPRIQELAVASTYHLNEDPLSRLLPLLRGYLRVCPLLPEEVLLLPSLVAARCVATLSIGSWRRRKLGENANTSLKNYHTAAQGLMALVPQIPFLGPRLCQELP